MKKTLDDWLATVRLQPTVQLQLCKLEQNAAVREPITFEEIFIIINNGMETVAFPRGGSSSTVSRSN